jgi:Ufm1-specific protease 2
MSDASYASSGELPAARPEVLTFLPPGMCHPVGGVFCAVRGESMATRLTREEGSRRRLQETFCAGSRTPQFRPASAWGRRRGSNNVRDRGKIVDVHASCPPPPGNMLASGAALHMVAPGYRYYHYMQDGFDDKGWGCAYRSLQTLWSWFEMHHYTDRAPPDHEAIQQTLVDVGDKQPHFVGSKDWIGSQGVGYNLDEHLGVSCKFIFVQNGAELGSKARDIAAHFDTHGTPIMMGGGALAFTILGVAWNEQTGDAQFLILDPHYTGSDGDVAAICTKEVRLEGYRARPCGWRGADSFSQRDFYNLCCPMLPDGVV